MLSNLSSKQLNYNKKSLKMNKQKNCSRSNLYQEERFIVLNVWFIKINNIMKKQLTFHDIAIYCKKTKQY